MTSLMLKKSILYCPVLQVLILTGGTFSSFLIAYFKGDVSLWLPFISETGAFAPEKCIFSLSLTLGSALGALVYFFRYLWMLQTQLNKVTGYYVLNIVSLAVGVASMVGLAGVAAFPMTSVFWAHLAFAGLYFLGSGVYFIIVTFTTYKIEGKSKIFVLRLVLTISITVLLLLLLIIFPISLINWHANNQIMPAVKKPGDVGFVLVLISSLMEWLVEMIIIAFTISLMAELRKYSFLITVKSELLEDGQTAEDAAGDVENPPTSDN